LTRGFRFSEWISLQKTRTVFSWLLWGDAFINYALNCWSDLCSQNIVSLKCQGRRNIMMEGSRHISSSLILHRVSWFHFQYPTFSSFFRWKMKWGYYWMSPKCFITLHHSPWVKKLWKHNIQLTSRECETHRRSVFHLV